jgi:hypothetical protein
LAQDADYSGSAKNAMGGVLTYIKGSNAGSNIESSTATGPDTDVVPNAVSGAESGTATCPDADPDADKVTCAVPSATIGDENNDVFKVNRIRPFLLTEINNRNDWRPIDLCKIIEYIKNPSKTTKDRLLVLDNPKHGPHTHGVFVSNLEKFNTFIAQDIPLKGWWNALRETQCLDTETSNLPTGGTFVIKIVELGENSKVLYIYLHPSFYYSSCSHPRLASEDER